MRRVGVGTAPFPWEVVSENPGAPLHISSDRFRSMEAAYSAGQDRLVEFLQRPRAHCGKQEKPAVLQASAPAIGWHADEADETGMDGDLEADGTPSPDSQPRPTMLDDRAA